MNLVNISIVEATEPCRFSSASSRFEHVVKHVVEGRDQRWHRVVDADLLARARDEHAQGSFGQAMRTLADVYEALLSDALRYSCEKNSWHCHIAETELSNKLELVVSAQVINAWPPEHGLFVVAGAVVRNDSQAPYRIRTGFRPWPELRGKALLRAGQEKAMERLRLVPALLLVSHAGI